MDGKLAVRESVGEVEALRQRVHDLEESLRHDARVISELQRSDERLRTLLQNSPDTITVMSPEGLLLFINRAIPRLELEEVIGKSAMRYMPTADADRFGAALRSVAMSGKPGSVEVEVVDQSVWQTRLIPLTEQGEVTAIMGIGSEVTSYRRTEGALRKSEEKVRVAVDAARMGLWSFEAESGAVVLDAPCADMLGLPPYPVRSTLEECLWCAHPEDQARVEAAARAFAASGALEDFEFRVLRRKEIRWLLVSGKRSESETDAGARFLGGAFDVTLRRALEDHVRQTQKMEAVGQLTAGIAHNFNNLLTVIIPSIQLARRESPDGVANILQDAEYAACRAAELIRELMLFACHARATPKKPVDVRELLERTLSICRATFDRSIEVEIHDAPYVPTVLADVSQLEQVFLNICLNARDALETHSRAPRRISITLDLVPPDGVGGSGADSVRVRISDNGPGMTEEIRRRIFEPFFTTKDVGRGSGLGLATAYAIAVDHDARLICESRPGFGATFSLVLPALAEPSKRARNSATTSCDGNETVLLIDDERGVRSAVRGALEPHGYKVYEAADGPSGFELFQREYGRIDLILLDLSLPGIPGEAVLAGILRERPKTRVIVFTGGERASVVGARATLQKPLETMELLRTIRKVCDETGPT